MLSQIRKGVTWTYAGIAVGGLIQLGVTGATARLLAPSDFGLVAMANVLMRFGAYFAQMGVGRALIQRQEVGSGDIRAAFTSSTLLGAAVTAAVVLSAPLAALYFGAQEVIPVVRWLALTFIATGLGATAQALLRRDLRFRATSAVEVGSYVIGYAVPALWLAHAGFGVWSLVVGAVGQGAVASALAYLLTRHTMLPTFDLRMHRRLLGFGTKVSIISILEFIGSTVDSVVIGRFGTAAQLGLYNRAFMLASLPTYHLNNGISKVLFPVLSGGRADGPAFRDALTNVTSVAIRIVLPTGVGMAFTAPELVRVVLGSQWLDSIAVFRVLAIGLSANVLASFPGIALEALGTLRAKAIVQAVYVVGLAIALWSVTLLWGFNLTLLAAVVTAATAARVIAYFALVSVVGVVDRRAAISFVRAAIGSVAVSAALCALSTEIGRAAGLPDGLIIASTIAAGVVALVVLFVRDVVGVARRRSASVSRLLKGSDS